MKEFLQDWSGVASVILVVFWIAYNVYQNWRNRKERLSRDAKNEQEGEFDLVRSDIEKIKERLRMVEFLFTVPEKPEIDYHPSKGITIRSKKEG